MNEVTVCLTSTARWDLLRITIESFLKYNIYEIKRFHVHDDSGIPIPQDLKNDFPFIDWTRPCESIIKNQIRSLDYLWWCCETDYAFFCEDDWEFLREGFIEDSIEVLQSDPKILQCWLQIEDDNKHPIEWGHMTSTHDSTIAYGILKSEPNLWAGTRFNPALKRKCDYDLIAPFSKHTEWNPNKAWKSEADISKVYHKLGFKGAILPNTYIKHIGQNRHVQ